MSGRSDMLRPDQDLLAFVCEHIPFSAWVTDDRLRVIAATGGISALRGSEAVGRTVFEAFACADASVSPIPESLRALNGETVDFEAEWLGRAFAVTIAPHPRDHLTGTVGVALDITEQKRAEASLREAEDLHSELFDSVPQVVFTYNFEGVLLSINAAGERALGYTRDELCGLSIDEIAAPGSRAVPAHITRHQLRAKEPVTYEIGLRTRAGQTVPLRVTASLIHNAAGAPAYVQAVAMDLRAEQAERRELQERMQVEALATLAAELAREQRKLLAAITGQALLLRNRTSGSSREAIAAIAEAAERAARLNHRLIGFAETAASPHLAPVDLCAIARDVAGLAGAATGVRVTTSFPHAPALVEGNARELKLLLLQLVLNAAEAASPTGSVALDVTRLGTTVELSVRDTGPGIPEAIRSRIFEPFFTTRQNRDASGAGLTVVQAIVRRHGGTLRLDTGSKGTTFSVAFAGRPQLAAGVETAGGPPPSAGRPRVLIVSTEVPVRLVLSRMLEDSGFEALHGGPGVAGDPPLAAIRVVVADLAGSCGEGWEYLEHLAESHPRLRFVIAGAPASEPRVAQLAARAAAVMTIDKPYSMLRLADAVRAAAGAGSAQSA